MRTMRAGICLLILLCPLLAGAGSLRPEFVEGTPLRDGAWPSEEGKFSFVVFGDRTGSDATEWPVFDRAVEEANLLRPDFVIMVGDLIEGYSVDPAEIRGEWADFWEHTGKLEAPFLFLPGNHDISNPDMLAWWAANIGRRYFSFEYQGCHFLALNTQEHWADNAASMGEEQIRFALDALAHHDSARHTFVFMHVPLWVENSPEWARIEAALGDRPHTVLAGHYHRLRYEERNDRPYIVLNATKGREVDVPNELPELGAFPHYAKISVDGDDVRVALIEPGNIWAADVAPRATQAALAEVVRVTALAPEGLESAEVRTGIAFALKNGTEERISVTLEYPDLAETAWQTSEGEAQKTIELAPGASADVVTRFSVPSEGMTPTPRLRYSATYKGKRVVDVERNAPLFPAEMLRHVPEWMALGPFPAGDLPRSLPGNVREAMPGMFVDHGASGGFETERGLSEGERSVSWKRLQAQPEYGDGFLNLLPLAAETPVNVLGYASCAVRSPRAQTVYAQFRVDDYGQVYVNGTPVEGGRVYRTRKDGVFVGLPLNEGWNNVTLKVATLTGGWSLGLLVGDPAQELEFAAAPPR